MNEKIERSRSFEGGKEREVLCAVTFRGFREWKGDWKDNDGEEDRDEEVMRNEGIGMRNEGWGWSWSDNYALLCYDWFCLLPPFFLTIQHPFSSFFSCPPSSFISSPHVSFRIHIYFLSLSPSLHFALHLPHHLYPVSFICCLRHSFLPANVFLHRKKNFESIW